MKKAAVTFLLSVCAACASEEAGEQAIYEKAAVERRTIEVAVSSTGAVEPLATVEVKSKASGEVLELHVENGDFVEAGTLLVRIDPRIVRNRLAQAQAELTAARSRREIARTQMERARRLLDKGTFTDADVEQATLDLANADAQVVASEVSVENARIAVDDTDIRAPISGTVIQKPVEKGQVISSPTQDFAGGTLLMQMADLSAVQIRALVDETDIGKIQAGMKASISVAAYPNQPFPGAVMKIEPQAVVEQNVTMFAVLVSIQNPEGLLLPGMNAEVEISIARSENALTIPVMALRMQRDIAATAGILGMSEEEIRAALAAGDSDADESGAGDTAVQTITLGGRTMELPEGIDAAAVRAAVQKRRGGGELNDAERALLQRVFQATADSPGGRPAKEATDYRFGGDFWVVVDKDASTEVRKIRTGITDLDRVEIVSGLEEGEAVLQLPSSHLVETQQQLQDWINRRMRGRSVPGIGR